MVFPPIDAWTLLFSYVGAQHYIKAIGSVYVPHPNSAGSHPQAGFLQVSIQWDELLLPPGPQGSHVITLPTSGWFYLISGLESASAVGS